MGREGQDADAADYGQPDLYTFDDKVIVVYNDPADDS